MFRRCFKGVRWIIRLRGLFHCLHLLAFFLLFSSCLCLIECGGEWGLVEAEVEEVLEICGLWVVVGVGEGTEVGTVVVLLAEEWGEEEVLVGWGELIHNNC